MAYSILLTADGFAISAGTATEAVRKAKALLAIGKQVTVIGPDGKPVDIDTLENTAPRANAAKARQV